MELCSSINWSQGNNNYDARACLNTFSQRRDVMTLWLPHLGGGEDTNGCRYLLQCVTLLWTSDTGSQEAPTIELRAAYIRVSLQGRHCHCVLSRELHFRLILGSALHDVGWRVVEWNMKTARSRRGTDRVCWTVRAKFLQTITESSPSLRHKSEVRH